ncbi:ABC transporter substrate-binding protein [Fluviispira vulneris]|uniref:ABC transporter substrate-binding protein n=1 Tax=Fluviispira vulneris TaxID=2763012 RepID=UPI0016463BA0|nr:ABC transporter substrate-binding protein [Fluviispira vulneris]
MIKMKYHLKIPLIFFALTLFAGLIYFIGNNKSKLYADFIQINNNEVITVNMSEFPQIPWGDDNSITVHVSETFSTAVHGSLANINHLRNVEKADETTLLKDYICESANCIATLKKGIRFHNGREVTAYDIEFSFLRQPLIKKFDFASSILNDLIDIENTANNKINYITVNGIRYPSGIIKGINVKDIYNIVFHFKRENNFFFQKASEGRIPIVPIEEFDDQYIHWKKYPVGFGKYRVISADYKNFKFTLERVRAVKNIPKYIMLIFSVEDIGDVKMSLEGPKRGLSPYDKKIIFPNISSNMGFIFNYQSELGSNPNFRKALSLALDREKIARLSLHGEMTPEDQMLPNFGWYKEYRAKIEIQKQNITEAKKFLESVPHHLWKNKKIAIPTFWANINSLDYIREVKAQLSKIGLEVEFLETDPNYTEFRENDPNAIFWSGFAFASDDPNRNFAFFYKSPIYVREYPNDRKFDELFLASTQYMSNGPLYTQKLSEYFTKNNIMVIVANTRMVVSYDTRKIASLGLQPNGSKLLLWEIKAHD